MSADVSGAQLQVAGIADMRLSLKSVPQSINRGFRSGVLGGHRSGTMKSGYSCELAA